MKMKLKHWASFAEIIGAWQSQNLCEMEATYPGKLSVPKQWRQPSLWMPW